MVRRSGGIRASNGARPQGGDRPGARPNATFNLQLTSSFYRWVEVSELLLGGVYPHLAPATYIIGKPWESLRKLQHRAFYEVRNGVQLDRCDLAPEACGLKRNSAASGEEVENL